MSNEQQTIEIYLDGDKGADWHLEGPQGYEFYIKPLSKVLSDEMELIRSLPVMNDGRIIIVCLTRSYVVSIAAATLNPNVQVTLLCLDVNIQKYIDKKTKIINNISSLLVADLEAFDEPLQAALFNVRESTDRSLIFDLLERLAMVMPIESLLVLTVPTARRKDLFVKLNKHIKNVISDRFVRKSGVLMYGFTKDCNHGWTSREARQDISIKEGIITLYSRPGCGYKSIEASGLALAEVIDFEGEENIIELNCSNGLTSLLVAKRMLAQEKSPQMMTLQDSRIRSFEMCKKNIKANEISFAQASLSVIYEGEQHFDIIIAHSTHFKDKAVIEDIMFFAQKSLSKGGKLYLISKHHATYSEVAKQYDLVTALKTRRGYEVTICQRDV